MTTPAGRARASGALKAVLLVAVLIWIAVAVSNIQQKPGIESVLTGVFGGFMLALIIAGAGAWAVMLFVIPRREPDADQPDAPITGSLETTLAELEAVRTRTVAQVRGRAIWRIPVAAGAGVVLWLMSQHSNDPGDGGDLVLFAGAGGLAGYFWASHKLAESYRKLYKARVLPQLAAQFGNLAWRPSQPDVATLRHYRLFEAFDNHDSEDEVFGDHRGLPLSLMELKLTHGSGKNRRTIFNGLIVAVTLPRGLAGTTVVASDKGPFGNLGRRLSGGDLQRVRLEDPEFEKHYEVYGSDQIGARALLTPAFMQRFMELAKSQRFGTPVGLADGNRFLMALPSLGRGNLFEPPSYRKPAAAQEALRTLSADLRHVIEAADAVIDLDQAGRRARSAEPSRSAGVDPG